MKKLVRNIAKTSGITFTKEEKLIYGFEEGDVLDLTDLIVHKQEDENISNILAKQQQEKTIKKIKEMTQHD